MFFFVSLKTEMCTSRRVIPNIHSPSSNDKGVSKEKLSFGFVNSLFLMSHAVL